MPEDSPLETDLCTEVHDSSVEDKGLRAGVSIKRESLSLEVILIYFQQEVVLL